MSNNAMSNETDLDWLARNVHKWVPNELLRMKPCGKGDGTFRASWCYSGDGGFTKDQWLARRAELQNKPGWDDFGESAKFMAQDSDGAWMAFESEPAAKYHVWSAMRGWCGYAREGRDRCRGEVLGDWRDTLEKRQEQNELEPFVSVEDSQEKEMKRDNGWFERGELPPVGCECEILGAFGHYQEWFECKIIAEHNGSVFAANERSWMNVRKGERQFRPLRTERDVLIEIIKKTDDTDDRIADAILAAGFKRGTA